MKEVTLRLSLDKDISALRGSALRKAICREFQDEAIFSQHAPGTGRTISRYPRIQYRVTARDGAMIYGIAEGADRIIQGLAKFPESLQIALRYGEAPEAYRIRRKMLIEEEIPIEATLAKYALYRTLTPIILIDARDRKERFDKASAEERALLAKKWLTGNIMNALKSLSRTTTAAVDVPYVDLDTIEVRKKGIPMIGLRGTFAVNVELGNMAVGHYVSCGFGVIGRENA